MSTLAVAARAVLLDAFLLRNIVVYQRGLPIDLVVLARDAGTIPCRRLPMVVSRLSHPIPFLERLARYACEQPAYFRRQPKLGFDGFWLDAIKHDRLAAVIWADHQPNLRFHGNVTELLGLILKAELSLAMAAYVAETCPAVLRLHVTESQVLKLIASGSVEPLQVLDTLPFTNVAPYNLRMITAVLDCKHQRQLDMLRHLHESNPWSWATDMMDTAASTGQLAIVQFLHENRSERCTSAAMDAAASNGRLDIVQYLHENRTERCTINALTTAADHGHFHVVQFLLENRLEATVVDALRERAIATNYSLVQAITDTQSAITRNNSTSAPTIEQYWMEVANAMLEADPSLPPQALQVAAAHGNMELTKHLVRLSPRVLPWTATDAARHGHTEIVKHILEHAVNCRHEHVIAAAAAKGHVATVQFLHENYHEHCTPKALIRAAYNGHLNVLQYLDENCTVSSPNLLPLAVYSRDLKVVRFVFANYPTEDLTEARAAAVEVGRDDILEFLNNPSH